MRQNQAHSLADAAAQGFSDSALRARGAEMTPAALSIAQRFDPYRGSNSEDRQATLFQASLERRAAGDAVSKAGLRPTAGYNPAAQPYRGALNGARDMECLTQAVYYEARGETPAGQAAVAQVVLNRVRHPAFPKSVCGVVFQGAQYGRSCQFSFACDGSLSKAHETGAWRRAQKVAGRALAGSVMADVGNATHFHALRVGPQWNGMIRVSQVGLHVFYRFGGRNGAPNAFRKTVVAENEPRAVYASLLPIVETPHLPVQAPKPDAAATPTADGAAMAEAARPAADAKLAQAKPTAEMAAEKAKSVQVGAGES